MKLKSADSLSIEDESIDVVACQVSPLRPYLPSAGVDSLSYSNCYQPLTPDLIHTANCSSFKEPNRHVNLGVEQTPSRHSTFSEKQVEQSILYDDDDIIFAKGLDSSGETLVGDTATHEAPL